MSQAFSQRNVKENKQLTQPIEHGQKSITHRRLNPLTNPYYKFIAKTPIVLCKRGGKLTMDTTVDRY